MKEKIKANYIYILEFIFFLYVYLNIPAVSDRWIGAMGYESMEDIWKYIFVQYSWLRQANARIAAQFVCGFFEQNIVLLSCFNALLTTVISIFIYKITNKDNFITKFMSVVIMLGVSLGIQAEVYFYATTLYMGAVFFVIATIYILSRPDFEIKNSYKKYLYLTVAIGALWLESSAVSLFAMFLFLCIYSLFVCKKNNKVYNICFVISSIGMGIMFLSSIFATQGRLSYSYKRSIKDIALNVLGVSNKILFENIWILLLLFVMLFILYKQITFKKNNFLKKAVANTVLIGSILNCMLLIARQIFMSIIQDPTRMRNVAEAVGWKTVLGPNMYDFFYNVMLVEEFLLPLIGIALAVLILIVVVSFKEYKIIGLILCPVFVGLSFFITGIEKGDRVLSISIFMIGALVVYISSLSSFESVLTRKRVVLFLCILAFLGIDPIMRTVKYASEIEKERIAIAQEVVALQQTGNWDYNSIVTMPRYNDDINLIWTEKNPRMEHPYYQFLLMHYNLDEDTVLTFSDTKDELIMSYNEDTEKMEWNLVAEEGRKYRSYEFTLISAMDVDRDGLQLKKDEIIYESGIRTSNSLTTDVSLSDGIYCYYICTVTKENGKKFSVYAPQSIFESK